MNVCAAGLAVVMMCASMGMVYSDCTRDAQTYICQEIPQSFPEGLSSLVLILGDVGEINSSVFRTESLASVTRLTFTKAGITNISTGALTPLRNLTTLILDQNSLSQITPPSWLSHPALLQDLSLLQNHIQVLENSTLHGLTGLTSLNLAKNRIRTIAPGSFGSQAHLKRLDLSGNLLTRVDPVVFLPLSSTSIRLDGNPWDCSCGGEDFFNFLRDLQNASMLEREMEVTCKTPEALKDQPVWNVSKCVIPPPTDDLIQPTAPTMHIPVPTLIGLIVVLCALVSAVCVMRLIYRRKQRFKQVKPTPEVEQEEERGAELENTPREPHQKCTDAEEMINWDSELVWRIPKTGVRAKSANAVLSSFRFCGDERDLQKVESEIEGPSGKRNTSQDDTKNQGVDSEEDTKTCDEDTTIEQLKLERNLTDEDLTSEGTREDDRDAPSTGNGSGNHAQASEDTETIPYLSIGGDLTKPNINQPNGWHADSQGQRLQMAWAIGRVSTWPPTSIQWKTRCATQEERLSLFLVLEPPQEPEVKVEISLEGDNSIKVPEPVLTDTLSPDSERCEEHAEEHQEPDVEPASLDYDPENPTISTPQSMEPAIGSTEFQSELPDTIEPPTASAEILSELQDSIQLPIGSIEILSESPESPDSTEPLIGSEEFLSEPPNSTRHPIESSELLSDPPESIEPPVESRQSQLCLVSFETASTEIEICPEDGSEPTVEPTEPQSEQVTVSQSPSESQRHLSQAGELDNKPDGTTDLSESPGSQKKTMINQGGPRRAQEPGGGPANSLAPPSGGIGLLHEVVQNHGRWTRERWIQTNQNKLLYRHKGQGH